jgi:hypothetical protein
MDHSTLVKKNEEGPSSKTPPPIGIGKDVGKKEPSYTAGGNAH